MAKFVHATAVLNADGSSSESASRYTSIDLAEEPEVPISSRWCEGELITTGGGGDQDTYGELKSTLSNASNLNSQSIRDYDMTIKSTIMAVCRTTRVGRRRRRSGDLFRASGERDQTSEQRGNQQQDVMGSLAKANAMKDLNFF